MKTIVTGLALCATLAGAGTAFAETVQEKELRSFARCGVAASVYRSLLPPAKSDLEPTADDLALYEQVKAAEPTLRKRADALAAEADPAVRDAIAREVTDQFKAQISPPGAPRKTPREALDLYAPLLEACVTKAALLPKD
jgi:hypothetical protein